MRVSQLIHAMDKEDPISIDDFNKKIDEQEIYHGCVRGIKRDDPINRMHVMSIAAVGDVICVLATGGK